jgi:hypothetical protein
LWAHFFDLEEGSSPPLVIPRTPLVDKKEKAWAKRLMDNYKLTTPQYLAILAYQGGVCYACGCAEHVKGRRLAVDHCHTTGLIRGLLCSRCNPVLGKLERAFVRYGLGKVVGLTITRWFLRMAKYAQQEPATEALGFKHFGYPGRTGTKAHRARLRKERRKLVTSQTSNTEGA